MSLLRNERNISKCRKLCSRKICCCLCIGTDRILQLYYTILLVFTLYNLITIPYRIAFEEEFLAGFIVMDSIINFVFFIDIVYRMIFTYRLCLCWCFCCHPKICKSYCQIISCFFKCLCCRYCPGRNKRDKTNTNVKLNTLVGGVDKITGKFDRFLEREGKTNKRRCFIRYYFNIFITKGLLLELLSLFPLEFVILSHYGRMIRFLSIFRVRLYKTEFEKLVSGKVISTTIHKILNSFILLLLVIHFFACVWWWIARFPSKHNNFTVDNTILPPLFYSVTSYTNCFSLELRIKQYQFAWYYAATHINGFNAPIPQSTGQAIYSCVYLIVGAFFFVLIVSSIGSLLHDMNKAAQEFNDRMNSIERYFNFKKITNDIKMDVKKYFRMLKNSGHYKSQDEGDGNSTNTNSQSHCNTDNSDSIFHDLEISLRKQVAINDKASMVEKVSMFQTLNDRFFIEDICLNLGYLLILRDYTIIQQGTIGRKMFFLVGGEVDVVVEFNVPKKVQKEKSNFLKFSPIKSTMASSRLSRKRIEKQEQEQRKEEEEQFEVVKKTVATLKAGTYFGEIALLMESPRTASIIAKTNCEVYVLNRRHFKKILQQYPEYRKIFEEEARKRMEQLKKK